MLDLVVNFDTSLEADKSWKISGLVTSPNMHYFSQIRWEW